MKLWPIHAQMGVPESLGSDVPNLMNDVPNFVHPSLVFLGHPSEHGLTIILF